jgi:hypothetical protein
MRGPGGLVEIFLVERGEEPGEQRYQYEVSVGEVLRRTATLAEAYRVATEFIETRDPERR